MDCSAPGFSVHGISQARILECVPTWPLCPSTLCPAQRTLVLQRAAKSQSPGDSWWLRQATCPDPPLSFPPSCTKAGICDQPLDKETIHKSAGRDVGRASAFPSERCWCTRSRPSSPVLTTAKFKKPHYDHKATGVKRKAKRIEKKKKIQVSDGISESPNLWTCRRKRNHVLIKPLESGLLIWESQNKFLTYI